MQQRSSSRRPKPTDKLYSTARWHKVRAFQLAMEPTCAMCEEEGRVTQATVCDHVTPHRGDEVKFWAGPFQSLCQSHHSSDAQRLEKSGRFAPIIGVDGWPVEPNYATADAIRKKAGR